MSEIAMITLDCGHVRTQRRDVDPRRYGKRDKAICKFCGTPELITKIMQKANV